MKKGISRREFGRRVGVAAAGAALAKIGLGAETQAAERQPVLTIAHLTDAHVQPEARAGEGLAKCLQHVRNHPRKPQLILNGGDAIMDSFNPQNTGRAGGLWNLWKKILKEENSLPVVSCIGNHDVYGWGRGHGNNSSAGKKIAMDALEMSARYYSHDRAGWHFICLDSTHPFGSNTYTAKLDEEQFEWLAADLAKVDNQTPVLVMSHIPIVSACSFFYDSRRTTSGDWVIPHSWMHIDARRLKDLFAKHPNVKLCLSGHIHMEDRIDYNGVTYLCNGAVCSNWWRSRMPDSDFGYGLIKLYADGAFEHEYVKYGWEG